MLLRVLCFSPRTPPAVRPQAILIGKMIPEWIRQGIEPIIVSYDNNGKWEINAQIYNIPAYKSSRIFGRITPLQKIHEYFYCLRTSKRILPILQKEKIQVMFSFANPQICNLVCAMLKDKANVPFVAHFSDPWVDHPYEKMDFLTKFILSSMEKYIVKKADAVVFVNPVLRDLVMRKYPKTWAEKTIVIPHCFDPSEFDQEPVEKNEIFTIKHIGAFYPQRNPKPLFEAAKMILDRNLNNKKFKIQLIGATTGYAGMTESQLKDMIEKMGVRDIVEVIPGVEYLESLKLMRRADCLISIDADIPGSPFLQSKIIDYASTGLPILGITPKGSPTGWVIDNLGFKTFDYTQIPEMAVHLASIINGQETAIINSDFRDQFHVKNTTRKLLERFSELQNKIV